MTNIYNLPMDYKHLLKRIRDTLLVSQADLAKMLNITFATVNRWENGHHEPSIRQKRAIRELCRKNGISMED